MGQFIPNFEYFWPPAMNETGWTIGFYGAGLDPIPANEKTVYDDQAETTPLANPVAFDVDGKVSVVLGSGAYKVVVRNPLGEVVSIKDNVSNSGGTPSGAETFFVDSIEDLRNFDRYTGLVVVAGYYTPADGGGGSFYWNESSTAADNGGYTISPASLPFAGRWIRIPDEDGLVRAASFGAVGNSVRTSELVNARTYAAAQGLVLYIHKPVYTASITFTPKWVEFGPDGIIRPSGTTTVTFQGLVKAGAQQIFSSELTVVFNAYQVSRPEWFGALQTSGDNSAYFTKWLASGGGALELPPGSWKSSTTLSPSLPINALGNVTSATNPFPETFAEGIRYPAGSRFQFSRWYNTSGSSWIEALSGGFEAYGFFDVLGALNAKSTLSVTGRADVKADTPLPARVGGNIDFMAYAYGTGPVLPADPRPPALVYSKTIPANYLLNNGDRLDLDIRFQTDWAPSLAGFAYAYLGGVDITPSIFNYLTQYGGHATRLSIIRNSSTSALASWVSNNAYMDGDILDNGFTNYTFMQGPTALPGAGFGGALTLQIYASRGDSAYGYMDYLSLDFKPKGST